MFGLVSRMHIVHLYCEVTDHVMFSTAPVRAVDVAVTPDPKSVEVEDVKSEEDVKTQAEGEENTYSLENAIGFSKVYKNVCKSW